MATIADIATGSEDFNILTAALQFVDSSLPGTDLIATLADPGQDLTVFAPTDAAFTQLAVDIGFDGDTDDEDAITGFLASTLGAETIRDVILYHVSAGGKSLAEIQSAGSVDTLNGATMGSAGPTLVDQEPDLIDPSVILADVPAENGVVHGIDRVLLPVDLPDNDARTITGIVLESGGAFDDNPGDFDLLLNAVQAAGLAGALDDPDADLTVFAPTDAAFVGLAQSLGFNGTDEGDAFAYIVDALTLLGGGDPIPLLTQILTYHVAPGSLQASQVLEADSIATLQGGTVGVDGTTLVDADAGLADPNLIATDIQAKNGVVHVIDGVLQPISVTDILGAPGTDFRIGSDRNEIFFTGGGNDFVDGNRGHDKIITGSGDDIALGGGGRDILLGWSGNDTLLGERGSDTIFGGKGNDTLNGGAGGDKLFGGRGEDTFVFTQGGGRDRIFDFQDGHDLIDISDLGFSSFEDVEHLIRGNHVRSIIDFGEGDKIVLFGVDAHELDADDFIFAPQEAGDVIA